MKDKKHMVIVGVAVLAVVLVAGVGFNSSKKDMLSKNELKDINKRGGIFFGGSFNEFQYISDEDLGKDVNDQEQSNMEDLELEDAEIKKTFENNRVGEILGGETGSLDGTNYFTLVKNTNPMDASENEVDDESEAVEMDLTAYQSKGYEKDKVICDAVSHEEADSIANQISGTLLSWDHGVATIQITESVDEFLKQYEQQGGEVVFYRKYIY